MSLHSSIAVSLLTLLGAGPLQDQEESKLAEDRATWNRVFQRTKERGLKWEANEFLVEVVTGRNPGKALDIGMGQGRNALFLAENGWDVTGFDLSDEAVEQAAAQATAAELALNALQGDVNAFDYGVERWDLVVAMYMHGLILPRADEIVASLAPGGILVIEGFHRDVNLESVQGGYFGYATNELLNAFGDLRILYYEDRPDNADWGRSAPGEKPIVRFIARKPLATVAGLHGPYLGQTPPLPKVVAPFAPRLVNTEAIELNGVLAPGGREFFFTRIVDGVFTMFLSELEDGAWSVPRPINLYADRAPVTAVDMAYSVDGERLYWLGQHVSSITPAGEEPSIDLWWSERVPGGWSAGRLVPPPISLHESAEVYPSVVADGSLYFTSTRKGSLGSGDIWRAQRQPDGTFAEPVNLGSPINTKHHEGDTWVSPDESLMVLSSRRPGGQGLSDLWVSFRAEDGSWSEPKNLGPEINTAELDYCPMGTPDGSYLFFSRRDGASWAETTAGDVFWIDASWLEDFR